jgi:hypothetical protein
MAIISSFFVISFKYIEKERKHASFILYFGIALVCTWLFCTIKLGLELGKILKNSLIIGRMQRDKTTNKGDDNNGHR